MTTLTETATEKYARWERENATAREAALSNPNTWIQVGGVEDAGDVGGDVQAGPAWSKRFIQWMPSIGTWAVVTDAYYMRFSDDVDDEKTNVSKIDGIERQTEYMFVRDPDQPGDTEKWSNYVYETVCTEPHRSDYDAYARELAADSQAADYPDPIGPSWVTS